MLLEERPSRGLRSPRPPTRGIAPGPFLRRRKLFLPSSFRMKLKDPKREPTGAMKTKKKPVEKACFLSRLISFVFPGCTASGWRCFTPPSPWAAVPQPARKETIYLCKGVSAWRLCRTLLAKFQLPFFKGASAWRLCRTLLANTQSSSAKECVRVTRFHRESVCLMQIAISGNGCRVNDPAGVWGKAPQGSPMLHRETV